MKNISKIINQIAYDPLTGIFKWKESGKGRRKDLIAGCVKQKGNNIWRRIVIDGQEYTSGQLAWIIMKGEIPEFIIDHIDGNPLNDKWENIRRGDNSIDQRNAKLNRRNRTGVAGVKFMPKENQYHAFIGTGKDGQKYLGCSKDFFEAVCLRKSAENKLGYSYRHGSK